MGHKEKMKCAPNKAKDNNMHMNMDNNMNMGMEPEANMNPSHIEMEDEKKLESLYPRTYFILIPAIRRKLDVMEGKKGNKHIPDRQELNEMVREIFEEVEEELKKELENCEDEDMMRQFGRRRGMRRRLIGDLAGTALIGELLGRRRRHYPPPYGYPGGYYGYPPVPPMPPVLPPPPRPRPPVPGPGYYPPYPGY